MRLLLTVTAIALVILADARADEARCSDVRFRSANGSKQLSAELCIPSAESPFPAVVDLRPRTCEGPAGIPPGWEQTVLPSWGYAVLAIDSFATRGLTPAACAAPTSLGSRQIVEDAYSGLKYLGIDPRIDRRRIGLLGFGAGVATAVLVAETAEARDAFVAKGSLEFSAFFAVSPYCNLKFPEPLPHLYAPGRIFAGEKDDFGTRRPMHSARRVFSC